MTEHENKKSVRPMSEKERAARAGDSIVHEPDAVDIKPSGVDSEGREVDETWYRAGGSESPDKVEKPAQSSEKPGEQP